MGKRKLQKVLSNNEVRGFTQQTFFWFRLVHVPKNSFFLCVFCVSCLPFKTDKICSFGFEPNSSGFRDRDGIESSNPVGRSFGTGSRTQPGPSEGDPGANRGGIVIFPSRSKNKRNTAQQG